MKERALFKAQISLANLQIFLSPDTEDPKRDWVSDVIVYIISIKILMVNEILTSVKGRR